MNSPPTRLQLFNAWQWTVRITHGLLIAICGSLLSVQVTDAQTTRRLPAPPVLLPPITDKNYFAETSDAFVDGVSNGNLGNFFDQSDSPFSLRHRDQEWAKEVREATTISRYRSGFYQKMSIRGGWVAKDDMGFGGSFFRSSLMVAVGVPESVVLISPSFELDLLSGPEDFDVPNAVYGTYLDLVWRFKFNSRGSTLVGIRPGLYSDFDSSFGRGYRTGALAAVTWDVFPGHLTLFGGAIYLDRNDYDFLPAAGLIWTPTSDLRFDLVFPKPKISKRVGHVPFVNEDWAYVALGIGGGTYDVTRESGIRDELTLRDFRLSVGVERIRDGGPGWFVETGWVFGRRLQYGSDSLHQEFPSTFAVEAGMSF